MEPDTTSPTNNQSSHSSRSSLAIQIILLFPLLDPMKSPEVSIAETGPTSAVLPFDSQTQ